MSKFATGLAAAVALLASFQIAQAAEIRVITVGGLQRGIGPIAQDFAAASGHQVKFTYTNPANLSKSLVSEGPFDVVVVASSSVDELEKAGKLQASSHVKMVRGGIAVTVKEGVLKPDISTPEKLKAAIAAAKTIVYTDPATPNGSGEKTKTILSGIGAWDMVVAKGRKESLGTGKELVAKGDAELGLFNASEAEAPGCVIAGIIPASIQQYTNYDAAVLADAASKDAAGAFVKFLASEAGRKRWQAAHLEYSGS